MIIVNNIISNNSKLKQFIKNNVVVSNDVSLTFYNIIDLIKFPITIIRLKVYLGINFIREYNINYLYYFPFLFI